MCLKRVSLSCSKSLIFLTSRNMYVYYFIYLYNATDIHMLYLFFCVMLSYGIEYIDALRVKVQWVSSKIIYIKFFKFWCIYI